MKIYTQRTKNDLTAWAPIRLGGPNKNWGPGIDLRTPWKIFSMSPWLLIERSVSRCDSMRFASMWYFSNVRSILLPQLYGCPAVTMKISNVRFRKIMGISPFTTTIYDQDYQHITKKFNAYTTMEPDWMVGHYPKSSSLLLAWFCWQAWKS